VFAVLLKVSLLAGIHDGARFLAVFLAPLAGRYAPICGIVTMKYVRGEDGLGFLFKKNASFPVLIASTLLFFCVCCLSARQYGAIAAGATVVFVAAFTYSCKLRIGGWTGDTLGASVEMSEAIPLLVFLVAANAGSAA